jgi:hypothetical protein
MATNVSRKHIASIFRVEIRQVSAAVRTVSRWRRAVPCGWTEMLVALGHNNSSGAEGDSEFQGGGGAEKKRGVGAINEFRPAGLEGGGSESGWGMHQKCCTRRD